MADIYRHIPVLNENTILRSGGGFGTAKLPGEGNGGNCFKTPKCQVCFQGIGGGEKVPESVERH